MKNDFYANSNGSKKPSRLYVIIPLILLICYATYLIGRAMWDHFKVSRELANLEDQIETEKDTQKRLELAIEYYKTQAFKEKEARAKLGYQKKGEHVISLPPSEAEQEIAEKKDQKTVSDPNTTFSEPNYLRWWNFFFKGK